MAIIQPSQKMQKIMDHFNDYYNVPNAARRDRIYRIAYRKMANLPVPIKRAHALRQFTEEKDVKVFPFDLFAGQLQLYIYTSSMPLAEGLLAEFDPSKVQVRGNNCESAIKEIDALYPYMEGLTEQDDDDLQLIIDGVRCGLVSHTTYGHVIVGYNRVIPVGLPEIARRIEESKKVAGRTQEQLDYLEAMGMSIELLKNYLIRYADAAKDAMSETTDAEELKNLARIEDACRNLTKRAPETFFEAIQLCIIMQETITFEDPISVSLGRMDMVLNPFYEKDLANGTITEEEALDLIGAFRIKLAGAINTFQQITIGGCDKETGKDASNGVTKLILKSTRSIRYDQPMLTLRICDDTPDEIWEEALLCIENGDGLPALYYDDVTVKAFEKLGVDPVDAKDYSLVGCVESTTSGQEFAYTEALRISWLKILELMLNNGKSYHFDDVFELKRKNVDLDSFKSMDEIKEWFKEEYVYFLHRLTNGVKWIENNLYKAFPTTLLSTTIDGCIENADDMTHLGAKYRFSCVNCVGMSNVVDSLLAIKKVVFEEKMMKLSEFAEALRANYVGYESLQAFVLNKCEKFGNDLPESNALFQELVNYVNSEIMKIKNDRGFCFTPGYYSAHHQAAMGTFTGATPDGRLAGVSLANSICPVQGMDKTSPTAVINSILGADQTLIRNGVALDLKFTPSVFKDPVQRKMFRPLCEAAFKQGSQEIQFNVVDRETLIAAQKDPDKYQNLLVRVSGYSGYFVALFKEEQDEIIARTTYEQM